MNRYVSGPLRRKDALVFLGDRKSDAAANLPICPRSRYFKIGFGRDHLDLILIMKHTLRLEVSAVAQKAVTMRNENYMYDALTNGK